MEATQRKPTDDWDQHWGAQAAMNALNPAQAYRHSLVLGALAIDRAPRPVRLLELGSGSGELASELLRKWPDIEVVGLDLSDVGVEISRRKVPGARFFQQDFTQPITLADEYRGWATHVVCSEVLEHLDDPMGMLRNLRPFFAAGCKVVVTVPAGPMSAFDRHIGHRRHFSARLLDDTLRGAGFEVSDLRGAGFPFFNLYRLVVVARGKRLVDDVADRDQTTLPLAAKVTMRAFSWLFRLNTEKTRLGWQLVAVGVKPR